jgi:DNA-binding MarR family transcriptional regulator
MAQNQRAPLIQRGIVDFIIAQDLLRFQIESALKPLELTLTQMSLLNHFSWNPARLTTITELTAVMAINQPGVTKAVGSLVEKGCLEKIDSMDDARVKHLKITPTGLDVLQKARYATYPAIESAFSSLNDEELGTFTRCIQKMKLFLDNNR